MKHKLASVHVDEFESLLQETESVLSNGGGGSNSETSSNYSCISPKKTSLSKKAENFVCALVDSHRPLILSPFG